MGACTSVHVLCLFSPTNNAEYWVSLKQTVFHCTFCAETFGPARIIRSIFVTICTEYRGLSLPADFRTKECRLWIAHKLRPSTDDSEA